MLLALAGVLGSITQRGVVAQEFHAVYFPWVANGEILHGQGPWYGKLSFQNLSDEPCAISIFVSRPGTWTKTAQLSINAGAGRSISANSLAVPSPGAAMRLEALCPIVASVKTVTPDVLHAPWSDGARIVTGYTGVSDVDVAGATMNAATGWFLPIVQTNSDWNSLIKVANLDGQDTLNVTTTLYPADDSPGEVTTIRRSVAVGTVATINVLDEVGLAGWVGHAEIRADGTVAALVTRVKPGADLALTNVATAADPTASGGFSVAAPLLFTAYNGWNTGINLANITDLPAEVTITYVEAGGGVVRTDQLTLGPLSMRYIYTPSTVDLPGFVGSALISSSTPVVAAIDEVKYETREAISYIAGSIGQQDAAVPVVFREDPNGQRHDNSGINVQNLNPAASQTIQIDLVSSTGSSLLPAPLELELPPGGNDFVYLPDVAGVSPGTVGSARLTTSDPAGFVALSNNVNYAVIGDGSVVFSAAGMAGYYRIVDAR
jgi:hypothetical protein